MELDEAYYIYRLLKLKGVGPVLVNKILARLPGLENDIARLSSDNYVVDEIKNCLDASQIAELKAFDSDLRRQIEKLRDQDARFISILSPGYPRILSLSLGDSTPPVLTCTGNLQLLEMPSVGFCGSRRASKTGLDVARECVEQLVREEIVLVSGYAAGIDQQVHLAALESGGSTIIVLPEGMLNFKVRKILRGSWDSNRVLVISEFLPSDVWLSSRAMQRNRTIVGLSSAMVLVEAGSGGGSVDAGKSSLKLKRTLYVPLSENRVESPTGNRELVELGATPLLKDKRTGKIILEQLIESVRGRKWEGNRSHKQLALF